MKQKTRPLQSVIRGPLVIFPLFKEWFSYLLDSASLYIFLIDFWLDIWKIIHFTWYFNEETSSLDIEKVLTVVIYIIDREMGDHFGNWLFLKPLVVLIMIILKKFMRWYFLRPIAQTAYFLTIVLGLYIIYAVLCKRWCMAPSRWSLWNNNPSQGCWRSYSWSILLLYLLLLILMKSSVLKYMFFLLFSISNVMCYDTVKIAVVSNFDTRLRKLLKDLNVLDL